MTRLLKVELGRLMSRRLFRLVVILGLLGVLVIDGIIAARSNTHVAAARVRATQLEQQAYDQCLTLVGTGAGAPTKADCASQRPAAQLQQCEAANPTHPEQNCAGILTEYFQDPRFHFADHAKDLIAGATYILMALSLVVAASSIGAEWESGTFAALLTWEPRRPRVLAAKVVVPVAAMTVVAALLGSVLLLGADLAAAIRGTTAGTTPQLVHELLSMAGRCLGLIALVSLIGAALATVTRHTVAVVAAIGGYLVAGELVGGIVSTWWRFHGLSAQLLALVRGEFRFTKYARTGRGLVGRDYLLHAGWAAVIIGTVAASLLAVAAVTLSRRDVT
jgi:ABC-2 type transport system permease protein